MILCIYLYIHMLLYPMYCIGSFPYKPSRLPRDPTWPQRLHLIASFVPRTVLQTWAGTAHRLRLFIQKGISEWSIDGHLTEIFMSCIEIEIIYCLFWII